jgi:hypothetical protein
MIWELIAIPLVALKFKEQEVLALIDFTLVLTVRQLKIYKFIRFFSCKQILLRKRIPKRIILPEHGFLISDS